MCIRDSLYSYSYDSSYNYIVTFSGESGLTSAIDYVVSDDLPVVYTLSGHGEEELSTSFSSSIEALNVEVNSLSLIETGEIPEDADCLLILAPESDISADELSPIQTYLAEGGGLILITDPEHESGERPNLDALMEEDVYKRQVRAQARARLPGQEPRAGHTLHVLHRYGSDE